MTIKLDNMSKRQCINALADLLSELSGVSRVIISLDNREVVLESKDESFDRKSVKKALQLEGYSIEE